MAVEMKNSGVKWIGAVPNSWSVVQLKRYVQVVSGKEIVNELDEDAPEAIPVYGSGGIFKYTDRVQYDGEVVLFGRKGTIGKPIYANHKFWAVDTMYFLKHNSNCLCPKFNYYQLTAFDWNPYTTKTALPSVVANQIIDCKFPFPPLQEQEAIANFLDEKCAEIDGLLADLEEQIKTLRAYEKSLIAETVTHGLNPNAQMKQSGIPWAEMIPAHWNIKPVYTHFHDNVFLNLDYEYKKAFKFNYGTLKYKNEVGDLEYFKPTYIKYSKIKKGDIIINGLNLNYDFISQRVAITPEDGIITSAYLAMRPFDNVYSEYFCYLFKSMDNMKLFHGMGKGIRLTLSFDELKRVLLPIPTLEEQKEIVRYLDDKISRIEDLIGDKFLQTLHLKEYKSSLIYEYVTGKKQVAL